MNPQFDQDSVPGMGPKIEGASRTFLAHSFFQSRGIVIDKDTEDDANDPTTKLRPGLVLVKAIAGDAINKFVHSEHGDAPATNDITEAVILNGKYYSMLDKNGEVADQVGNGVWMGMADVDKVIFGTADAARIAALKAAMPGVTFIQKAT